MVKIDKAIPRLRAKNIILDTHSQPCDNLFRSMFFGEKSSESHRFKSIWEVDVPKTSEEK